ncbi:VOC family protein [Antribacter gilvus]|uniref:VOC family protein n=1 Tax=Antribacter gilvus TaxID=2304675 RepID=UPI000F7B00CC|nr:VOC family protein [Antribacter gilvus]
MTIGLWPSLVYTDAAAACSWLAAIGFTEHVTFKDEEDGHLHHAEYLWPAGGGVMFGTYHPDYPEWPARPGTGNTYLVTEDVDAVHAAALAAGGTSVREPVDEDHGRNATVKDPEGNMWSFGTYVSA